MGFLDAVFGRSKPVRPDLDQLFAVPSAAITLQVALGFVPAGEGAVCYKAAEGQAFAETAQDVQELLDADSGPKIEKSQDSYGFTWLLVRQKPGIDGVGDVMTDLHAVNSTLAGAGFGPALLCSLVSFQHDDGRRLALVYLYKSGRFYPFAPLEGKERRDNSLELQARQVLADDLKIEPDLARWFPVWGAPGL